MPTVPPAAPPLPATIPAESGKETVPGPEPAKTPPPVRRQSPAPRTTPVPQPSLPPVALPPPAAPAAPIPRLGEMLTPAQVRQSEAEFQLSLQRARAALSRTTGRTLTSAQRDTLDRIRVFINQALSEKQRDLATALQLVRRADLLGRDLLKGLTQ